MATNFLIAEDAFRNKIMNNTSFATSLRDMNLPLANVNTITSKRKLSPLASPNGADLLV